MHVHTASTTLSKVEEALAELLPPEGTRTRYGVTETFDDDLVDLRVHYLGGRDVLAVAVHADHDAEPRTVIEAIQGRCGDCNRPTDVLPCPHCSTERLVRVEMYDPTIEADDNRQAGLVEDVRRTWAMWFGQDGRPTSLWLHRTPTGAVLGPPIDLTGATPSPAARTVTIRRQDNGWDRFAFLDDDGVIVGEFTVDPRHVTLVHDRPVPPEWIGHGLPETAPPLVDGFALDCRDGLVGWMEAHPELVGEGSALDNVLRLLDHAYEENGCSDPGFLSAKTPTLHRSE